MQVLLYNSVVLDSVYWSDGWSATETSSPVPSFVRTATQRPDLANRIRYLSIGLSGAPHLRTRSRTPDGRKELEFSLELVRAIASASSVPGRSEGCKRRSCGASF